MGQTDGDPSRRSGKAGPAGMAGPAGRTGNAGGASRVGGAGRSGRSGKAGKAIGAVAVFAGGVGALHLCVLLESYPLLALGLTLSTTGVLALPAPASPEGGSAGPQDAPL